MKESRRNLAISAGFTKLKRTGFLVKRALVSHCCYSESEASLMTSSSNHALLGVPYQYLSETSSRLFLTGLNTLH